MAATPERRWHPTALVTRSGESRLRWGGRRADRSPQTGSLPAGTCFAPCRVDVRLGWRQRRRLNRRSTAVAVREHPPPSRREAATGSPGATTGRSGPGHSPKASPASYAVRRRIEELTGQTLDVRG